MSKKDCNKSVIKSVKRNLTKQTKYEEQCKRTVKSSASDLPLLINPVDTPENPLTHKRLMDWLAETGWVEGYVKKRISPMDAYLYEDFAQNCWLEILQCKPEKIMEVWYKGKGKFINYLKTIIDVQLKSCTNPTYKTIKKFYHEHYLLTDEQWKNFEEGIDHSTCIETFPVRYDYPTGNRKKMVVIECEESPITIDKSDCELEFELEYE